MTFTPQQVAALSAPLHASSVKQRTQAGRQLSYIEAWHAIAEANRIFGYDAWTRETVDLRQLGEPRLVADKYRVGYSARVRVTVWAGERAIVREGCGFGSGIDKDLDQAHESALKEAESDAMKRALMTFGNPFGLALYDKAQANVTNARLPAAVMTGRELLDRQTAGEIAGHIEDVLNADVAPLARKSSSQAKKDGDDETIKREIGQLDKAGLADFHAHFDEYTATMPRGWLDPIRDMLEARLEELNGAASVAEQEAELDAAFRGTMGSGSGAPSISGRNGQQAAA